MSEKLCLSSGRSSGTRIYKKTCNDNKGHHAWHTAPWTPFLAVKWRYMLLLQAPRPALWKKENKSSWFSKKLCILSTEGWWQNGNILHTAYHIHFLSAYQKDKHFPNKEKETLGRNLSEELQTCNQNDTQARDCVQTTWAHISWCSWVRGCGEWVNKCVTTESNYLGISSYIIFPSIPSHIDFFIFFYTTIPVACNIFHADVNGYQACRMV